MKEKNNKWIIYLITGNLFLANVVKTL